MLRYFFIILFFELLLSNLSVAAEKEKQRPPETRAPAIKITAQPFLLKDNSIPQTLDIDISHSLERVPGLILSRSGGPLDSIGFLYRGYSNKRTEISVAGIPINSPLSVWFDLSLIPPTFIRQIELNRDESVQKLSLSGSSVNLLTRDEPNGISFVTGSFGTYTTNVSSEIADTILELDISRTEGDFEYRPVFFDQSTGRLKRRINNQKRRYGLHIKQKKSGVEGMFLWMKRGIPGFDTHQDPNAEENIEDHWIKWEKFFLLKENILEIETRVRYSFLHFQDPGTDESPFNPKYYINRGLEFDISTDLERQISGWDILLPIFISYTKMLEYWKGGYPERLFLSLMPTLKKDVEYGGASIKAGVITSTDRGMQPTFDLKGYINADHYQRLSISLTKGSRFPDFYELYYPDEGYLRGNPDLKNEDIYNISVAYSIENSKERLDLEFFVSPAIDEIVYANINAYTISPINTGRSLRLGLTLNNRVAIFKNLSFWQEYYWTISRVKETGASIPGIPVIVYNSGFKYNHGFFSCMIWSHSRSKSYVNLTGGLTTPGYMVTNFECNLVLRKDILVGLRIDNLTDRKDRVDRNRMPLPGRAFYLSIGWKPEGV